MAVTFEVVVATPSGKSVRHTYPTNRQAVTALGMFRKGGFAADAFAVERTLLMVAEADGGGAMLVPFEIDKCLF